VVNLVMRHVVLFGEACRLNRHASPRTSFVLLVAHIQRDFPTRIVIYVYFFPFIRDTCAGHFFLVLFY
jgi:hypothetical protein